MSRPPVFWFTRSTNAGGKLCSWPNRIPIFFIKKLSCRPKRPAERDEYFRNSERFLDFARNDKGLKPFRMPIDRKSTRLNSSHSQISYAVFCLKKKKIQNLPK